MKKKIVLLAAAFLMTLSVTFANGLTDVPEKIVKELNQEFRNAGNIQWKITDNYYKAIFTYDEQELQAFYSFEGVLIATSRNITISQLPLSLIREVKKLTTNSEYSDLFELLTERGTEYFITVKNDKETKNYKSTGYSWSVMQ